MKNLLTDIESSFHHRFSGENRLLHLWKEISRHFPPTIEALKEKEPHLVLSRDCGDMGLAILWIVQTILIHRLVELCEDTKENKMALPADFGPSRIGALAHSEPGDDPVIIQETPSGTCLLSGTKKYITGGLTADVIFITARKSRNEKIDSLIVLPSSHIEKGHIKNLEMESLNTIDHGRLILRNLEIPESMIIQCEGRDLRRSIAVLSTLERDLIMESYIGSMLYLNNQMQAVLGEPPVEKVILKDLLAEQKATTERHFEDMKAGRKLEGGATDFNALVTSMRQIKETGNSAMDRLTDDLKERLLDLKFLQSLGKSR